MFIRSLSLAAVAFVLTGCPDQKAADDPKPAASAEPAKPAAATDQGASDKAGTEKKDEGGW